jgi:hypothetical protein
MRVQAIVGLLGAMLAGCTADAYSSFPSFMRANAPPVSAPEQPPAVGAIVRDQLASVFLSSALPHNVQVSPAHRDPRALNWIACVKADLTTANGREMPTHEYRITIADGKIVDRRLSNDDDNCASEHYEPI